MNPNLEFEKLCEDMQIVYNSMDNMFFRKESPYTEHIDEDFKNAPIVYEDLIEFFNRAKELGFEQGFDHAYEIYVNGYEG